MQDEKADIEVDKKADSGAADVADRGESLSLMEPLLLSSDLQHKAALNDLVLDLTARSASFRRSMPESIMAALADLVRAMNCYYSNLIEGHNTHPIEIERALKGDYSADAAKRNLQLEAKAHIAVQQWIDAGGVREHTAKASMILEIHRRFVKLLPAEMLWVSNPDNSKRAKMIPGKLRTHDVVVGQHVGISPGAVCRFLDRFEQIYSSLNKSEAILATAAAHHRLLWIHPFIDGNGRVARLMSHAQLLELLGTGGVWSIARGLARNVDEYRRHLMACDRQRRNSTDGRGNLSEKALAEFTAFFLTTCIDQVKFMESLVQPDRLRNRILLWGQEQASVGTLPANANAILEAVLYRGQLPRSDIAQVTGASSRHARRTVSALTALGVLTSRDDRSPLTLAFPATLASHWIPGLFPDLPGKQH